MNAARILPTGAFRSRVWLMIGLAVLTVGVVACLPPIPQDPAYHNFADQRTLLGVPHCLNVISNIPFLIVGVWGLIWVFSHASGSDQAYVQSWERAAFALMFVGVGLTAFGSGYYHLDPYNARLVWDRLPITIVFMAFFAITIGERIGPRAGLWLLGPLLVLGAGSIGYWHWSEERGAGDLRPYALVQFYPLLAIPLLLLLFPPRYTRTADVVVALGWYGLAKLFEWHPMDAGVFALGQIVSGHTLKHVAAALGGYWILRMLQARRPLGSSSPQRAPEQPRHDSP